MGNVATIFMMMILMMIEIAVKKINFMHIATSLSKTITIASYSSNYTFNNSWLTRYTNVAVVVMHFSM